MLRQIKRWIRTTLGFSQTESNGFLILIPLMLLAFLAIPLVRKAIVTRPVDFSKDARQLDSLIAALQWDTIRVAKKTPTRLFTFDPNTVTHDELISLGLSGVVAKRIVNYRKKGGQFRKAEDLLKMYGMDTAVFNALQPFVRIPPIATKTKSPTDSVRVAKIVREKFNLNLADTTQLKSIFGIGTTRAKRIVTYREKLGGFHSSSQLFEVFGLDSAVVKEIENRTYIDPDYLLKRLPLNSSSEKELSAHPYLNTKNARAIAAYRFQHGKFQSIEELQNIANIPGETFHKIKPYLSLD